MAEKEYIEREAAIDELQRWSITSDRPRTWINAFDKAAEIIESIPAADVREVKRGKWDEMTHNFVWNADGIYRAAYKCSNCEQILPFAGDFCPNCGADMRRSE